MRPRDMPKDDERDDENGTYEERERWLASLRGALSGERLDSYRADASEPPAEGLARYAWNATLSEALYPSLQALEVTLRNAVHAAVADRFEDDLWFFSDDPRILKEGERAKAEAVRRELGRRGKPETPGRIVAELNFGFWTSLFGSGYEQTLWPSLLKPVFPQATNRQRRRKALSVRLNGIRRLRNRVFHHEPVYQLPSLPRLHGEIVETIGWSSPAAEDLLRLSDRFPKVHDGGAGPYRERLYELLPEGPEGEDGPRRGRRPGP